MLTLAAVALVLPGSVPFPQRTGRDVKEYDLSFDISIVLLLTYALSLLFTLHTHKQLFAGHVAEAAEENPASWPMTK